LATDVRVLVEDGGICLARVNPVQAVVEPANVDDASCQAEAAKGVAYCTE
jgi:hypothetical protein